MDTGTDGSSGSLTIEELIICTLTLCGPLTAEELQEATGLHRRTVQQRLEFLYFDNVIGSTLRSGTPRTIEYSVSKKKPSWR